jgi:hypothetical protein
LLRCGVGIFGSVEFGQQNGQQFSGALVAGIDTRPQEADSVVEAPTLDEQPREHVGGVLVARIGPGAQEVHGIVVDEALQGEQRCQQLSCGLVTSICAASKEVDRLVATLVLDQHLDQPFGRSWVADVCLLPEYGDGIVDATVLGQSVGQCDSRGLISSLGTGS